MLFCFVFPNPHIAKRYRSVVQLQHERAFLPRLHEVHIHGSELHLTYESGNGNLRAVAAESPNTAVYESTRPYSRFIWPIMMPEIGRASCRDSVEVCSG